MRVDALYEKVRIDGRIVNMAVMVVCGVDEHGQRDVLAIEPMLEESEATYLLLFRSLQERSLRTPRLVISDAYSGLMTAIRKGFPGTSWQRCKVHFMRNILARVPHKKIRLHSSYLVCIHQGADLQAGRISMPPV